MEQYRDSINKVFADPEQSILTDEDLEHFESLHFYPANQSYEVEVRFKRIKKGAEFEMKTTTERLPVYKPYGRVKFKVGKRKFKLTVYQNIEVIKMPGYEDVLFLPFTDLTSGDTSYGGGRYLDMRKSDIEVDGMIDFNLCYNPYCAYNPRYSCPIPPLENHLDIRIEAGVMKWHD
jgi:uncharacterized protein (DUF1684 family)